MTPALWRPAGLFATLDEAARWNALISWSNRVLPLTAANASCAFAPAEPSEPDAFAYAVEAGAGFAFRLQPQDVAFKAWVGVDLQVADLPVLPEALRDAIGQGLVDLIWNALPDNRLGRARVIDSGALSGLPALAGRTEWFEAVFAGLTPEPIRLRLALPVAALLELLGRELIAAPAARAAWAAQLLAEVDFSLGGVELSLTDYRALRSGDVVVLAPLAPELTLVRTLGRNYRFQAQPGGGCLCTAADARERYRAASPDEGEMRGMSESADAGTRPLSVIVDFDLGRTTMTLAEVEGWKPGVVVPLAPPARAEGAAVTLRVNGQAVGEGDLVRIDDRLAVLITRLVAGG